jgi:hypothetical protein
VWHVQKQYVSGGFDRRRRGESGCARDCPQHRGILRYLPASTHLVVAFGFHHGWHRFHPELGPAEYSARQGLERDVLSLSGLSVVVWLEGINDFGSGTNATVEAGMREVVDKLQEGAGGRRYRSVRLGATGAHGSEGKTGNGSS